MRILLRDSARFQQGRVLDPVHCNFARRSSRGGAGSQGEVGSAALDTQQLRKRGVGGNRGRGG